jgi:hypothetical protein
MNVLHLYYTEIKRGDCSEKFSILGNIMFLRATGVLSLNEILCYLARKYPNSRISYQTIQGLYDLATKVQTTGAPSRSERVANHPKLYHFADAITYSKW